MNPVIIIAIAVVFGIGMASLVLFTNVDEMVSETISQVDLIKSTIHLVQL